MSTFSFGSRVFGEGDLECYSGTTLSSFPSRGQKDVSGPASDRGKREKYRVLRRNLLSVCKHRWLVVFSVGPFTDKVLLSPYKSLPGAAGGFQAGRGSAGGSGSGCTSKERRDKRNGRVKGGSKIFSSPSREDGLTGRVR